MSLEFFLTYCLKIKNKHMPAGCVKIISFSCNQIKSKFSNPNWFSSNNEDGQAGEVNMASMRF